jgi:hypothetical protein
MEITGLYIANCNCDWLQRYGQEFTDTPPYSPDLLLKDTKFLRR